MGDVIVVFRVMPTQMENFESIKKDLEKLNPQRLEEEPIAFGLKAIKFTKLIPDAEGEITNLEKELREIKNVKDIETLTVSRSL